MTIAYLLFQTTYYTDGASITNESPVCCGVFSTYQIAQNIMAELVAHDDTNPQSWHEYNIEEHQLDYYERKF